MDWLNYHHLFYFFTVAREGSIARACEKLHLAQPTISGQLRQLESTCGGKLFFKQGRGLALTELGQIIYDYAEQIFSLGRELQDTISQQPAGKPRRLHVGISDAVPKLIAYRVLAPVLALPSPVKLVCEEGSPSELIAALVEHSLDVVLTDTPVSATDSRRHFNHLLGSSQVTIFGAAPLARRYRRQFPHSLEDAPFLLPSPSSSLRRSLDLWFHSHQIQPAVIGEFKDSALVKIFASAGKGLFAAPRAIESDIVARYGVQRIGHIPALRESFYAVSIERRLKHPAVVALCEAARDNLFARI
ncbi:MAG: transcriptional activator NhaR [Acidobacteriota bacterium]|jgi:LysR family transcriptional activator of nhaA